LAMAITAGIGALVGTQIQCDDRETRHARR
jgi:hypothetical protein